MGGTRARRLQGVEVKRRATNGTGNRSEREVLIRRICVRYEDGRRACFVPEAKEEFFSRDDVRRVVGMLHAGSEYLEWGPTLQGEPGTERFPGTGPYDTGAV
ncbi:MAG TPA: hypothetical protein VJ827_14260 [Rubrobacter sp.]|nr:hypothetical protein [Rubrobacter sp.]